MRAAFLLFASIVVLQQYGCDGGGDDPPGTGNTAVPEASTKLATSANQDEEPLSQHHLANESTRTCYGADRIDTNTLTRDDDSLVGPPMIFDHSDESFRYFVLALGGATSYEHLRSTLSLQEWDAIHRLGGVAPREPDAVQTLGAAANLEVELKGASKRRRDDLLLAVRKNCSPIEHLEP
jgi:hypothetical protein